MNPLDRFEHEPRWVAWRNEPRPNHKPGDKLTKIPYSPRGGKAKADNPATWGTKDEALACPLKRPDGGGVGIELGDLGDDLTLAGIDADSCRNLDGTFADWAKPILQELASTYTEISPSLTGVKSFFLVETSDVRWFLDLIGVPDNSLGARRSIPGQDARDHGPAIEPFFGGKYFTVTGKSLTDPPREVALFDRNTLSRLTRLIPPASSPGSGNIDRSAKAFGKAAVYSRAHRNCSYEEMVAVLRADSDPDIASWIREKGEIANERELKRIWLKTKNGHAQDWKLPLVVRAFDEIDYDPSNDVWLVEDLLLTEEISLIYGPPNVGKTFLALNISLAVADSMIEKWFDRRLTHGNVAYIASEGGRRIDKRIAAWKSHHLYARGDKKPFWLITEPVDLCHKDDDTDRIIAALRSRVGNEPLALLTIETVNSVLNGGDENSPEDMGVLIANVRRLRDEFNCHVMLIHHPPHGREAARGHTSLPAAVDTEFLLSKIEKSVTSTVTMRKQREAEKVEPFSFTLKVIQLGDNRDEKPISSCVVESAG